MGAEKSHLQSLSSRCWPRVHELLGMVLSSAEMSMLQSDDFFSLLWMVHACNKDSGTVGNNTCW